MEGSAAEILHWSPSTRAAAGTAGTVVRAKVISFPPSRTHPLGLVLTVPVEDWGGALLLHTQGSGFDSQRRRRVERQEGRSVASAAAVSSASSVAVLCSAIPHPYDSERPESNLCFGKEVMEPGVMVHTFIPST